MTEIWDILNENGEKTGITKPRGFLEPGEFHAAVAAWILTDNGEFVISKRAANKDWRPLMWETAGGCVAAGEEGIAVALREVREELGIELNPANGRLFSRYIVRHANGSGAIVDSWLFRQDVDLADITLCPDENCDVMLANRDKIRELAALGQIVPYPNLEELFEASYLSVS